MKFRKASRLRKKYEESHLEITLRQLKELESLIIKRSRERTIDQFLKKNKNILSILLERRGHHETLVIPEQAIRLNSPTCKGLRPDYILRGKNSDGYSYWVVELKGADAELFKEKGNQIYLSGAANLGLCQLLQYISFCKDNQSSIKDMLKFDEFNEPKGILVIGREEELKNKQKREMKQWFNELFRGRIEIRTYDSLINRMKSILQDVCIR